MIRHAILVAAAFGLSACGQYEATVTSYEESMLAPVEEPTETDAPAPVNESIEGGADEQADEAAANGEVMADGPAM
ncbi:MAG: hypothetical protein WBA68_01665 [Alteraurantiacibacter sp.]